MLPTLPETPAVSAYIRKAIPRTAGTPAAASVTPAGLKENTASETGAEAPASGTARTEPVEVRDAVPDVTILCELREEQLNS